MPLAMLKASISGISLRTVSVRKSDDAASCDAPDAMEPRVEWDQSVLQRPSSLWEASITMALAAVPASETMAYGEKSSPDMSEDVTHLRAASRR